MTYGELTVAKIAIAFSEFYEKKLAVNPLKLTATTSK
jgi:hypothetical protein